MMEELIISGASRAFERSLLALVGSINVNWPNHPRILIYDLGMSGEAVSILKNAKYEIKRVPEFCEHWRQHFTWKIWCCHDVPSETYLWLDAGVCVLQPVEEAFAAMKKIGYFCPTNNWPLKPAINKPLQNACNLNEDDLCRMVSINGGIHGFLKTSAGAALLDKAMGLALKEENMKATEPLHRHDQALLSILLYKYFYPVLFSDGQIYAGWQSPSQVFGQKIWIHRQRMQSEDMQYFIQHIKKSGHVYIPKSPPEPKDPSLLMKLRLKVANMRGRSPLEESAGKIIYNGVRD
jgi:hypothetical protein